MKLDRRSLVAIGLTVVILVLFNVSIVDREKTISTGETLFLELAPVDPRSLMQATTCDCATSSKTPFRLAR